MDRELFDIACVAGACKTWVQERTGWDAGADPGFFLGGGALVSCSTSTPINHIVFFFFRRIPVVLENRIVLENRRHPLHPPPRSAPGMRISLEETKQSILILFVSATKHNWYVQVAQTRRDPGGGVLPYISHSKPI